MAGTVAGKTLARIRPSIRYRVLGNRSIGRRKATVIAPNFGDIARSNADELRNIPNLECIANWGIPLFDPLLQRNNQRRPPPPSFRAYLEVFNETLLIVYEASPLIGSDIDIIGIAWKPQVQNCKGIPAGRATAAKDRVQDTQEWAKVNGTPINSTHLARHNQ
jgi:hypothetical protein